MALVWHGRRDTSSAPSDRKGREQEGGGSRFLSDGKVGAGDATRGRRQKDHRAKGDKSRRVVGCCVSEGSFGEVCWRFSLARGTRQSRHQRSHRAGGVDRRIVVASEQGRTRAAAQPCVAGDHTFTCRGFVVGFLLWLWDRALQGTIHSPMVLRLCYKKWCCGFV